jgi:hypothetical protein
MEETGKLDETDGHFAYIEAMVRPSEDDRVGGGLLLSSMPL